MIGAPSRAGMNAVFEVKRRKKKLGRSKKNLIEHHTEGFEAI